MSEMPRQICTKDAPMPPMAEGQWQHPDAKDIGTCREGCCDKYECPHCGKIFLEEVPQ